MYQASAIRFKGLDVLNVDWQGDGPQIWWSEDSLHWRRASIRDFRSDPQHEWLQVNGIAAGESGLVAVGQHGDTDTNIFEAVVWKSADGKTWDRVVDENFGAGGDIQFVGATGAGFVAFGRDSLPQGLAGATGSGTLRVWVSADGSRWQRATSGSATRVAGGLVELVQWDATLTAFVASKTKGASKEIWRSSGLTEWHQVSTLEGSTVGFVKVAIGPKGWLALGLVSERDAAWTSPDGISWRRSGVPKTFVRSVIGVESGFVAVGYRQIPNGGCASGPSEIFGETSTSPDGRTWRKLPDDKLFNRASIRALVSRGASLFGLGVAILNEKPPRTTVWTVALPATSPDPGQTPKPSASAPSGGCGEP